MSKILSFKIGLLLVLWFGITQISIAQMHNGKWNWLLPDYVKLQYAGGIGFLSVGVGYTFGDHRIDATFFYGFVPKPLSVDELHSLSVQFTAKLIRIHISGKYQFLPLNIGWFLHHTFGSEYWINLPSHYPDEYYWWSPGRNAGVFLGSEIKTKWLASKIPASGLAFYARLGTRGLYVASKVGNSSVRFNEIIELGFGIALYR